ncbi:MAG: hypothetical protein ACFFA0_00090 [Promethearchaeota archaeon]
MLVEGHHNAIKSNRFENFEEVSFLSNSYENDFMWNLFNEPINPPVEDHCEGNFWEYGGETFIHLDQR